MWRTPVSSAQSTSIPFIESASKRVIIPYVTSHTLLMHFNPTRVVIRERERAHGSHFCFPSWAEPHQIRTQTKGIRHKRGYQQQDRLSKISETTYQNYTVCKTKPHRRKWRTSRAFFFFFKKKEKKI